MLTKTFYGFYEFKVCGFSLEHGSALELVAAGGHGELLGVLGVLAGGHHEGGGGHGTGQTGVGGQSADLARHALHALLGLRDGL